MKKAAFLLLIFTMLLPCGCDMFRRAAGRPTSEEVNARKAEIAVAKSSLDALKARQQALADSLAMEDSLRQAQVTLKTAEDLGGLLYADTLTARYYIIVGAFRNSSNYEKMLATVLDEGYIPAGIRFRNGLSAVGVCPVNTLKDAGYALRGVKREDFCPKDVWILVNR